MELKTLDLTGFKVQEKGIAAVKLGVEIVGSDFDIGTGIECGEDHEYE